MKLKNKKIIMKIIKMSLLIIQKKKIKKYKIHWIFLIKRINKLKYFLLFS